MEFTWAYIDHKAPCPTCGIWLWLDPPETCPLCLVPIVARKAGKPVVILDRGLE